jgi:hypothetical protein
MTFIKNRSKIYYDNSRHEVLDGWLTIIGRINDPYIDIRNTKRFNKVYVKFDSGYTCATSDDSLRKRNTKDMFKPSVLNIGYLGVREDDIFKDGKMIKEYLLWRSMLNRCYDPRRHKFQPCYKGCTVHKDWHNYNTFQKDIKLLDGHDAWIKGEDVQLDKDRKIKGNKEYSIDTCAFITPKENNTYNVEKHFNNNTQGE